MNLIKIRCPVTAVEDKGIEIAINSGRHAAVHDGVFHMHDSGAASCSVSSISDRNGRSAQALFEVSLALFDAVAWCHDVASLNYTSLNYASLKKLDEASLGLCSASLGLCVPRIMRPKDYASLGLFVPGRFVTICPHFSGRTKPSYKRF
jgi:hypothetical protein